VAISEALTVEPMRLSDIASVHEIERESFGTPWPVHAFEQELTGNRLARYIVARRSGEVVGFAGVWLMVDESHVTTFGVHPRARRQGVARSLLLRLLELSLELGAARSTLEVRVSNTAAQALYRSFGFEVAGRRPAYYSDDGEDALVMTTPPLTGPTMTAVIERQRRLLGSVEGDGGPAGEDR
jgi:[ribosomal protein S18]-alanine N-acetyltransferase